MNKHTKYLLVAGTALVVLGTTFYGKDIFSANTSTAQAQVERKVSVRVVPVTQVEKTTSIVAKGTIEPVEEGIISSKVAGNVVKVLFENSDQVVAGSPLVVIDDQDIRNQMTAAQVTVQKLTTNLLSAQRNYNRTKLLMDQGAVSQQEMDADQIALEMAKADLASAKVNLASLQDNLDNTIIRAPITGIIDEKNIVLGQMVSTGPILASSCCNRNRGKLCRICC